MMGKLVATLRDTQTGETRVDESDYSYGAESAEFYWTEGNMSCDCNRAIIFGNEDGVCCTGKRYELLSLTLDGVSVL